MSDPASAEKFVDVLSPLGRQTLKTDAAGAYETLVPRGGGKAEVRDILAKAKPQDLLSVPIKSMDDANAVLSGLWLWHDFLDESHLISQSLPSATGSFWHAVLQ